MWQAEAHQFIKNLDRNFPCDKDLPGPLMLATGSSSGFSVCTAVHVGCS